MDKRSDFSMTESKWLPVRRRDSRVTLIALTDVATSDFTDLAWPRPDFRIACLEFLIGLLATACPPEDQEAWMEWWEHPPEPDILEQAFRQLAAAFILEGDGPRFCQDAEELAAEPVPIERLLIDSPGGNTLTRNTDLLVKRDRISVLGPSAAAMALYTLQAFAPSGGAGHRTSVRGGGPLTTLVMPIAPREAGHHRSFWHLLWANVPYGQAPVAHELPLVFPWLAPTRRSEGDSGTVLGSPQAHRLQAFWGMPRRIRLDFRPALPGEVCGLTGKPVAVVATSFRTRPWGVQYLDAARFHPLTPTYQSKPGGPSLAVHPQPDGIGYRHWSGLIDPSETSRPAATVATFSDRKPLRSGHNWHEARVLVGGYDMDNAKARSFVEAEMPFFIIEDAKLRGSFLAFSRRMADGATVVANILRMQLRIALNVEESDRALVDGARQRFFDMTTVGFWQTLRTAIQKQAAMKQEEHSLVATAWLRKLRYSALELFDEAAPLDPLSPGSAGALQDGKWVPSPIITARRNLAFNLLGYGKLGESLFKALALQVPQKPKKEKARQNA